MKTFKTQCGDWHLGWGFCGGDKIGTLTTTDNETFHWKGHSQGRHGQVWNKGAKAEFNKDGNILYSKGSTPQQSEVKAAIERLQAIIRNQKPKKK